MALFKRRNKSPAPEEQKKDVELQEELNELTAAQTAQNVDRAVNEAERTFSDATLSDIRDISLIERGRCPECGSRTEMLVSSRVCSTCGWYRWRAQEANSCVVHLATGEKIKCDKIYNVKGNNVLCIRDDVVRHLISQSSIRRIDYVWDEEKLEVAQERFHKEQTGVWGGKLVWDALAGAVRRAEADDEWLREHPSDIEWVKDLVPYSIAEDAPVVVGMREAARDVLGREPEVTRMVAWTDSCWLNVLADTPVVVFSGANEGTVHGPDENIRVDDLVQATKAVALYLYRALSSV